MRQIKTKRHDNDNLRTHFSSTAVISICFTLVTTTKKDHGLAICTLQCATTTPVSTTLISPSQHTANVFFTAITTFFFIFFNVHFIIPLGKFGKTSNCNANCLSQCSQKAHTLRYSPIPTAPISRHHSSNMMCMLHTAVSLTVSVAALALTPVLHPLPSHKIWNHGSAVASGDHQTLLFDRHPAQ